MMLALRYADLPGLIPTYRDALGHATNYAPKSAAIVFRIAAMGLGQLVAATAMGLHARAAGNSGWTKFWGCASLAAAAKTLVECTQYAALGTPLARQHPGVWFVAALLPVIVFLGLAARLWLTKQLSNHAGMAFTRRTTIAVCLALTIWLGFATLPKWLG
jgi:hypothetical protein